jgi:hypothetical protein
MNTFVLGKQHLDERVRGGDIVSVIDDLVGLHSTLSTTPYLSLFARMRGFKRKHLERELYERRSLIKHRCMRRTVHILPKERFPVVFAATRHLSIDRIEVFEKHLGIKKEEFLNVMDKVMAYVPGDGWTTREAKAALDTDYDLSLVLTHMCDRGMLVRWQAPGGWKSNVHRYVPLQPTFDDIDLGSEGTEDAKRALVGKHIEAFGPTTVTDISWWSGLTKQDTRRAIENLEEAIALVEVDGLGGEHLISASQEDGLRSNEPGRRRVVNLVPLQDPYLLGYKDRERYLDHEHTFCVFDRSGNATSSILVDGRVVGVWDMLEKPSPVVRYHLFGDQSKTVRRKVEREASLIGRFIAETDVEVEERDAMVPLSERTAGSFMHPLKV